MISEEMTPVIMWCRYAVTRQDGYSVTESSELSLERHLTAYYRIYSDPTGMRQCLTTKKVCVCYVR